MNANEKPSPSTVVVELTEEQRYRVEKQLGVAIKLAAVENELSDLQVYLAAMYLMGGLAASTRVAPNDITTFQLFRKGYDNYMDWWKENEPRGKQ